MDCNICRHLVVPAFQETGYSCVAACLQMILSARGVVVGHRTAMKLVKTSSAAGATFDTVERVLRRNYGVSTEPIAPNTHTFRKYLKDHVILVDNEGEYEEPHAMIISGIRFRKGRYELNVLDPIKGPKWRVGSEITAGADEALACSLL